MSSISTPHGLFASRLNTSQSSTSTSKTSPPRWLVLALCSAFLFTSPSFAVERRLSDFQALAERFLPDVCQQKGRGFNFLNLPLPIDFHGTRESIDWTPPSVSEELTRHNPQITSYYYVLETSTHWFIVYSYFWPYDTKASFFSHSNDLETALVTVQRDPEAPNDFSRGRFRAVTTEAHDWMLTYTTADKEPFFQRSRDRAAVASRSKMAIHFDGILFVVWPHPLAQANHLSYVEKGQGLKLRDGTHAQLWSESGEHGLFIDGGFHDDGDQQKNCLQLTASAQPHHLKEIDLQSDGDVQISYGTRPFDFKTSDAPTGATLRGLWPVAEDLYNLDPADTIAADFPEGYLKRAQKLGVENLPMHLAQPGNKGKPPWAQHDRDSKFYFNLDPAFFLRQEFPEIFGPAGSQTSKDSEPMDQEYTFYPLKQEK